MDAPAAAKSAANPFDFEDEYSDTDRPDDDGRFDDAEENEDDDFDAWVRRPEQIAQVLAGSVGKQAEPRRRDMLSDLVTAAEDDSLKMLPFLRGAASEKDGKEYCHTVGSGEVRCAEWPLAVGCASVAGEPAWGWRVWDAAKLLAHKLESRDLQGKSVLELGAGSGLVSLVASRLGAATVACSDLARAMPLLQHNVRLNGGVPAEPNATREPSRGRVLCPGMHGLSKQVTPAWPHLRPARPALRCGLPLRVHALRCAVACHL